ncbi:GntR family transcriptional regulator [Corynebacterium sp.]|uniref:GntR family transcriptional regulator n=1 Tax=Corynebacterium sp. TaxID=1720 RepID=UPI0026DD10CE|nr:GntR family transcriptional regulator [Corynebacterium sp.]MDO5077565.1 GntR family transcriptional regulator [Corynebacterium sp.]
MSEATAPLFRQIATLIEDAIAEESLREGERAPSTNELANFHNINPATARRGLGLLVASAVLEKRRGVGMFVAQGAKERIVVRRREEFAALYLAPLIDEAVKLDMSRAELHSLVERVAESRGMYH